VADAAGDLKAKWRSRLPNGDGGRPEVYNLWSHDDWLSDAVDDLLTFVPAEGYTAIAAIATNGIVFGAAVADRLHLPLIVLRKGGSIRHRKDVTQETFTGWRGEVDSLEIDSATAGKNRRYLVIDDFAQTCASLEAATRLLSRTGNVVAAYVAFCNSSGRTVIDGNPVFSVITTE
jgi:adenine phosphoribosyltransferase